MRKNHHLVMIILLILALVPLAGATFPQTGAKTIGGSEFDFPSDALSRGPALFALAMGTSRENGEIQQQHLLQWQAYLISSTSYLREWPLYHFPVIDAPGFIQGVIRRGIAKSYEGVVDADKAAVLFIKNARKFSEESAIPIDNQATLVVVRSNGSIAGFVKGLPSAHSLEKLELLANN
ncbi:MAG: hypothetical protein VB025_05925 [Sphaerochaeta sp.]|nr:hypothetical protein [Sphaerochaeta sp.]